MATNSILTTLSAEKIAARHATMSRDSVNWLLKRIQGMNNPLALSRPIVREKDRFTRPNSQKFVMGGLYYFYYDPKTKSDLPYYDKFPLVIPLRRDSDGFMGLNLHYLPLRHRIMFMKKLLPFADLNDNDDIRRVQISYSMLDASSRFREFRPCIKKYLYSRVRSKIIAVEPQEWDIALYLPVQQFRGAQPSQVWKESLDQIRI